MDRVRFGKALGTGTREAARALLQAADAATTPDPRTMQRVPPAANPAHANGHAAAQATVRTGQQMRAKGERVKRGGKRFGEAVWGPLARASSVLWLEVTGVFFGLFALTAGIEVFKHRADIYAAGTARQHLLFAAAMLFVFGWFTVSSFVNAHRRGRR